MSSDESSEPTAEGADVVALRDRPVRTALQLTFVAAGPVPAAGVFAAWDADGRDDDVVVAALRDLELPTGEVGRLSSPVLPDGAAVRTLPLLPTVRTLAGMPARSGWPAWRRPSDAVLAWSLAAKLGLEVVTSGRVLPTLRATSSPDTGIAAWRARVPRDGRVAHLAETLPPAAFAVQGRDGLVDAHACVAAFLDAIADACGRQGHRPDRGRRRRGVSARPWVETWPEALAGGDPAVEPLRLPSDEVEADVEEWAAPALGHRTRGTVRLALRVVPPRTGDGGSGQMPDRLAAVDAPWHLDLVLQSTLDTEAVVEASRVWEGQVRELAGRKVDDAEDALVLGLAEAARIFTPLDRALDQAHPTRLEVTSGEASQLLADGMDELAQAGVGVLVPPELRQVNARRLRARLRIGQTTGTAGRVESEGLLARGDVATFAYEMALGDDALTEEEFREIVSLKRSLVRWRGEWVRVDHEETDRIAELAGQTGTMQMTEAVAAALAGQARVDDDLGWVEATAEADVAELVDRLSASPGPGDAEIVAIDGDLRDYQLRGVAWMQRMAELGAGGVLADEMGLGKAQPHDARVLTPGGWRRMGDLQVGDHVIGSKGDAVAVTGVYEQGAKDIYRVTFSDGSSTECCDEHLWQVNSPLRRWRGASPRVMALSEIRQRLVDGAGNRQHFIPMVAPVRHPEADLPLDPYLLGVLLGDGGLTTNSVMVSTADQQILDELAAVLPDGVEVVHADAYDHRLSGRVRGRANPVLDAVRDLGVHGVMAHEKHVPEPYLFGSVDQREALLQGLLDTDGHVRPADNDVEFSTSSPSLACDVRELVQSLGGTARIRTRTTTHRDAHRMSIALPDGVSPFRLARKADVYHPREKYPPSRSIASVELVGQKPARCIRVDAEDSLYVTDDHIVTHNTIMAIALLTSRKQDRPHLVVAPTSVVGNWERELRRFAPRVPVIRHHGPDRPRSPGQFPPANVVLTSYALLRRDAGLLEQVDWDVLVLDEAQQIKNASSKGAKAARAMPARTRFAMTGTPIENRLAELWSILDVTNPGLLGSQRRFNERFAVPIERWRDEEAADRLKRLIAPFVVRRRKADPDVSVDLPPKQQITVACSLTREQASLYQAAIDQAFQAGLGSTAFERRGRILALLTALKQICNHPAQYVRDGGRLVGRSGKLARATEILGEIVANGDHALVFTQFREMGEMLSSHLRETLDLPEVPFLHGGTPMGTREQMVDRFQEAEDAPPIMLVSLRAGGTGLNLTRATEVLHYDRWWNPAVEDQATDRVHRIGQTRPVTVHRLVTSGTIEERIADLLERKRALADAVVGEGETWITELDDEDLRELVALSTEDVEDDEDAA